MPPKILVHGSGAIGTIYIYLLLQAGCSVTAVCRSNYAAAKANGFIIDSDKYGQGINIRPNIVRTPEEAAAEGPFDFVIVSTKALPSQKPSTPEVIRPAVTERETAIVLIQNGIGIEDEYAAAFPANSLISCVVYLPTTQISPGHIKMGGVELLQMGAFPATLGWKSNSPAAGRRDQLEAILMSGGGNVQCYQDIQSYRWRKLLINASWNPVCALSLSRDVAFLASGSMALKLVVDVMDEVVAIAQAKGYKSVSHDEAREQLQKALDRKGTKGIEPSMLVDVVHGRRMEVEVILGNPIKIAWELGISVPRMETLYALLKGLDEAIALRSPGQSLAGDETEEARKASSYH